MSARALFRLEAANFRSHGDVRLSLDGRPVVLFGPNGAGKTNLLEAVSVLAPGRGLRRAGVEEITRRVDGSTRGFWAVNADLGPPTDRIRLGVGQDPSAPSRRVTRIDGEAAAQGQLARFVRASWLTPAQDRVFVGPRGERLKFLDRWVLALAPDHGAAVAAYEKALRERARVLEDYRADPAWLDALEAAMAEHGLVAAAARADTIARLAAEVDARPEGAFPKSDLKLDGALERALAAGLDAASVEADFRTLLKRERRRDAKVGRALDGPHRTDLVVIHRPKAMPAADCSTGEQKALLVGLALAHIRAAARRASESAAAGATLLLLDEAAAHLDRDRRAALIEELVALDGQAWLTGTDAELFEAFAGRAQMFEASESGVAEV